jgi:holliday junction DNA helicase RuvA
MIAMIEGELDSVSGGSAMVRTDGGLTYQVLLPGFVAGRLGGCLGQRVKLHTLYYIDSHNQGATLTPRLAGFLEAEDRRFFELFTTCKGIGNRKALRAMSLATGQIAAAIADRDVALLQTLPEIGRRTAETIVATLREKVGEFVTVGVGISSGGSGGSGAPGGSRGGAGALAREALEVLLQLGETRVQASAWIERALQDDPPPGDVQALLAKVYQIKGTY